MQAVGRLSREFRIRVSVLNLFLFNLEQLYDVMGNEICVMFSAQTTVFATILVL